ncbi:expressed unknown protein [Seminavis robusta]|uniref:Uncharacterized protein n=1 Tax=Seminavis robusta TaxID=568900 RepID=A0A9N8H9X6_9STRA|nr:expressed unknown protein [Seminavis robusta]|eukprot:Sro206_g086640.1 n/a (328) ;mRNA; r:62121-63104
MQLSEHLKLVQLPDHRGKIIYIERCTMDALKKRHTSWFNETIDVSTAEKDGHDSCNSLVYSKCGGLIYVIASFFVTFTEESKIPHRYTNLNAFCRCQDVQLASGSISLEKVQEERRVLLAFVMGLEPLSSKGANSDCSRSVRAARKMAFADGFFRRPKERIEVVSMPLGIGYGEMLFIRDKLGMTLTNKLLIAHGLLLDGEQQMSPLEPSFKCPETPSKPCSTANLQGEDVEDANDDDDDGSEDGRPHYYICMVGARTPDHTFCGMFACTGCYSNIEAHELETLQQKALEGPLSDAQQEQLQKLMKQHADRKAGPPSRNQATERQSQ